MLRPAHRSREHQEARQALLAVLLGLGITVVSVVVCLLWPSPAHAQPSGSGWVLICTTNTANPSCEYTVPAGTVGGALGYEYLPENNCAAAPVIGQTSAAAGQVFNIFDPACSDRSGTYGGSLSYWMLGLPADPEEEPPEGGYEFTWQDSLEASGLVLLAWATAFSIRFLATAVRGHGD